MINVRTLGCGVAVCAALAGGCASTSTKTPPQSPTTSTKTASSAPPTTTSRPVAVSATLAAFELPAPRSGAAATATGGRALVVGGQDANKSSTNSVWSVDPTTGTVAPAGTVIKPLHDAGAAAIGGSVFVFGGGASVQYDGVQRLVPGAVAVSVATLPGPRSDVSVATSGERAYVIGGYDGARDLADVLETADGIQFRLVAKLATPVRYAAVGVVGRTLWVVGGLRGDNDVTAVQRVDLDTGEVAAAPSLPSTMAHATGFVVRNTMYVAGGRRGGTPSDQLDRLDPTTGSLEAVGRLPYAVLDAASATVGDATFLFGGRRDNPIAQVAVVSIR